VIKIRREGAADSAAVHSLVEAAFGQPDEAELVDRLRAACPEALSLVALDDDVIVGHILFTPATVGTAAGIATGMGLAPLSVTPERQREGVGSALVSWGLELLAAEGCPFVIVLGYYPRFGFERASDRGLASQWSGVPDEAFMVLILDEERMRGASGVARYREEFEDTV
jgi:putative acetyltransferase